MYVVYNAWRRSVVEGLASADGEVCVKLGDVLERSLIAGGLDRNREERRCMMRRLGLSDSATRTSH